MQFRLWERQDYLPLQEDDTTLSEKALVNHLTRRQVPLSTVLCLFAVQSVLWIFSIMYLLHQRETRITLPLDSKLRDSLGNAYPAAAAVQYETRTFGEDPRYMALHGTPSNETDQAWLDLMGSTEGLVQLSRQAGFDIDHLPNSIESKNRPGLFVYGLEVHHQLHCLNRIRKSFHPQHYFPDETEKDSIHHREHCLDHIRQSIMCSGDIALDRWYYDADGKNWLATDVPHLCRDYSALQEWQETHRITQVFNGPG